MNVDSNVFCCGLLVLAAFISAPFMPGGGGHSRNPEKTETGYLIRRRRDGYPLYVNEATVHKALRTGDYYIDEHDTREIPVGQQYTDERLNR